MPNEAELRSIEFVKRWAEKKGITVRKPSSKGAGYDLEFVHPDGGVEKIEVKGSSKVYSIPDMRVSEFEGKSLKADFLYVVGNVLSPGEEHLYVIPRGALKPENLRLRQTYFISRFQTKINMEKYRIL